MKSILALAGLLIAITAQCRAQGLEMVGEAQLRFMVWPVYHARLYSLDGRYQAGQRPLRLEIEYLREIAAKDLVAQTQVQWQRLGLAQELQQEWLRALAGLWPDVAVNDVLALSLDDQGRSTFYCNGELLGHINNPAFGASFLDIWLSPDTSEPELRLALIGQE